MKSTTFLLAPLSLLLLTACSDVTTELAEKTPRPVQAIKLGDMSQLSVKQFAGVLEAKYSANLAFKVPGTIEEILVKTGDSVVKGQVIARLDPHDYQVTVLELEARLDEAQAAHALAAIELKRVKQASDDNAIASVNLDRAQAGYKRSAAMVEVVTQNLQKAQDALKYTSLTAPFNGVIGKRFSDEFEQAVPGIPVFIVHQPNQLQARLDMPESIMSNFNRGAPASVSWYGFEHNIPATIKEISTLPDIIKQTYTLVYALDTEALLANNARVLPGKAVKVAIKFKQETGQYCIPYSAIFVDPTAGTAIFTIDNGIAQPKPVTVNTIQGQDVCVSGNIASGDVVIIAGTHYIKPDTVLGNINIIASIYPSPTNVSQSEQIALQSPSQSHTQ
ncbi:efflux RND transporter periplasmic adaptor subunit [Photobacterium makurazakiensis]|uniref:efflux RND transporter periplasmic adaptor subunit n=1 Tax=Photobacterium makurazakiensis TaxID=2910234 RepID=UPI003D096F98